MVGFPGVVSRDMTLILASKAKSLHYSQGAPLGSESGAFVVVARCSGRVGGVDVTARMCSGWSAWSVDVCPMVDVDDSNRPAELVGPIDDAICPDSCRVKTGEVASQWFADPLWVLEQGTDEVVQDCEGDLVGESINGSSGRPGNDQIPWRFGHAVLERSRMRSASMSSLVTTSPLAMAARPCSISRIAARVREDRQCLFDGLQIVGAEHDGNRTSVSRDGDAFLSGDDFVDNF